jgi:hypothetical protein
MHHASYVTVNLNSEYLCVFNRWVQYLSVLMIKILAETRIAIHSRSYPTGT